MLIYSKLSGVYVPPSGTDAEFAADHYLGLVDGYLSTFHENVQSLMLSGW